jgi:hypothetical protein
MAFAFFLASDVGLSVALAQVLSALVAIVFLQLGFSFGADNIRGGLFDWQKFGSCVAFVLMILYTGRRYYWQVAKSGLCFQPARDRVEGYSILAFRILLLCLAGVIVLLVQLGLDWTLAVAVVLMIGVICLVVARVNAEAGLILAGASWQPFGVLLALLGATAMGPTGMVILALVGAITTFDARENLTPFMVNGLKLCDDQKVAPKRMGGGAAVAFVLALAVAVPVVLWADYNYGIAGGEPWASSGAPRTPFNAASAELTKLRLMSRLEESESLSPIERFTHMEPKPQFLWATGVGFVLVIVFSMARLRFPWWPFHPVIFILFSSWTASELGFSFLLGWMIKMGVMKLGGPSAYRTTKIFMIGVIAGDMLAGLAFMVTGAVYYHVMGTQPPLYRFLPGG